MQRPTQHSPDPLIVAISSRALFDLEDSHALFEREGLEAYAAFQRAHEDDLLAPGVAFPLVRKLLALNDTAPAQAPRVEVILLSRNSSDTGLRIFNSIEHHRLAIARAAFSNGAPPYPYIRPFGARPVPVDASATTSRNALAAGVAAATILPAAQKASMPHRDDQLRIAFDGDAVIFGDESERLSREGGLAAFARERTRCMPAKPLSGGPFRGFLDALHRLQKAFPGRRGVADPHGAGHRALGARAQTRDPDAARMGRAHWTRRCSSAAGERAVPGCVRRRHFLRRFGTEHRLGARPCRRRARPARRRQRGVLKPTPRPPAWFSQGFYTSWLWSYSPVQAGAGHGNGRGRPSLAGPPAGGRDDRVTQGIRIQPAAHRRDGSTAVRPFRWANSPAGSANAWARTKK